MRTKRGAVVVLVGATRATYRAYSGSSTVDSLTLTASEETVSVGFS